MQVSFVRYPFYRNSLGFKCASATKRTKSILLFIRYGVIRKTVKQQFTAAARAVGPDRRVSELPPLTVNGLSKRHRCRLVVCQSALQIELETTERGKSWARAHEILYIYICLHTAYMYCEFNAIKSGPAREMYY